MRPLGEWKIISQAGGSFVRNGSKFSFEKFARMLSLFHQVSCSMKFILLQTSNFHHQFWSDAKNLLSVVYNSVKINIFLFLYIGLYKILLVGSTTEISMKAPNYFSKSLLSMILLDRTQFHFRKITFEDSDQTIEIIGCLTESAHF